MTDLWDRIRRRLRPGEEPQTTSVGGQHLHDNFLDTGRISLEPPGDEPQDDAHGSSTHA